MSPQKNLLIDEPKTFDLNMDIFDSAIPNIQIKKIGSGRKQMKVIEAPIVLEAWDGYLVKRMENAKLIADGTIKLDIGLNNEYASRDWSPEINAYNDLLENQYELRDNIIKVLTEKFDWIKETYDWDQENEFTAETGSDFDFRRFIGPQSVGFVDEDKDGISYLEWHFNSFWDPEHGLAVLTHQARVIDLDRGETDVWKIYEDKGTLAEELRKYEERAKNAPPPKRQKPWWQFW